MPKDGGTPPSRDWLGGPEMLFGRPSDEEREGAKEAKRGDDFEYGGGTLPEGYVSPGARKEKLRRRTYRKPPRPSRRGRAPLPYAELHAASAFSFLDGASHPEDLVARAAELELPAVALADRNGLYGAPRFYKAAKEAGVEAVVGAEVVVGGVTGRRSSVAGSPSHPDDDPASAAHPPGRFASGLPQPLETPHRGGARTSEGRGAPRLLADARGARRGVVVSDRRR